MALARERYHLCVYLRFFDLESLLGEGPKKIFLQKLRRSHDRTGRVKNCDIFGKGVGDETPLISDKRKESVVRAEVAASTEKENLGEVLPNKQEVENSTELVVPSVSRREKRRLREVEYRTKTVERVSKYVNNLRSSIGKMERQGQVVPPDKRRQLTSQEESLTENRVALVEVLCPPADDRRGRGVEIPPVETGRIVGPNLPPIRFVLGQYNLGKENPMPKPDDRIVMASKELKLCGARFQRNLGYGCTRPLGHVGIHLFAFCDKKPDCLYSISHAGACGRRGGCPACGSPVGLPHRGSRGGEVGPPCPERLKRMKGRGVASGIIR